MLQAFRMRLKKLPPSRLRHALWVLRHGMPYYHTLSRSPGMITRAEREFFADAARHRAAQPGRIVDLGCWMCATSLALAEGLPKESGAAEKLEPILAYDQFIWAEWMDGLLPDVFGDYRPGDCFLPEARRRIRSHGARVQLIQADLTRYDWPGGAIKILLVDAMKSWELARQIACSFYPSLPPGALLIHQDYKHFYTSWLHLLQYRLRDCFTLAANVPASGTVAFDVVGPVSPAAVIRAANFDRAAPAEVEAAFRWSQDLVGERESANLAAAHVMYYVHTNQPEPAWRTYDSYAANGLSSQGEFGWLRERASQHGCPLPHAL